MDQVVELILLLSVSTTVANAIQADVSQMLKRFSTICTTKMKGQCNSLRFLTNYRGCSTSLKRRTRKSPSRRTFACSSKRWNTHNYKMRLVPCKFAQQLKAFLLLNVPTTFPPRFLNSLCSHFPRYYTIRKSILYFWIFN
jgi:hypothetical protein